MYMSIQDKIEFLRENVPDVIITDGDNGTPNGHVDAMFELYHLIQDERLPDFIKNTLMVVFAQLEDGNWDAAMQLARKDASIAELEASLGESLEEYLANAI